MITITKTQNTSRRQTAEKKESYFGMILRRLIANKLSLVAMIIFFILVLLAILAPWISPYSYTAMDMAHKLEGPSAAHWLGTDKMGRDLLSRLLYGGRYSIFISLAAVVTQMILGIIFGSAAGFFGGVVDNVIMRILDVVQSIPHTILMIALAASMGSGIVNTILAMGISSFPQCARLLRSKILSVREEEYVTAAQAIGCGYVRQILKHVLPNSWQPLIVSATMGVAGNILQLAALSYIGLGIQPPAPEWGAMLSGARDYIRSEPYLLIFPGLAIALTVLTLNLFGDGLRDALDPRLKK